MRKKKYFCQFLFCLFFIMCITTACSDRTDVSDNEEYIYCLNGDKTGLIKIEFEFPDTGTLETVEAVLAELAAPVDDIDYAQTIPDEIRVQKCSVDGMIAKIDFSSGYNQLSGVDEKLVRAAVVQSILEVDGIIGVYFTVDGAKLQFANGSSIGIMDANDFVMNAGTSISEYETTKLVLYFANETGDGLVAEARKVKHTTNDLKEQLIVENLLKGPEKTGNYPTINPQTTLLSVTTKDDTCYVNFDSDFLNRVYDVKPEIIIYSIVNSLIDGSSTVNKVQITVNGEKEVVYESTVNLSKPFEADLSLIK